MNNHNYGTLGNRVIEATLTGVFPATGFRSPLMAFTDHSIISVNIRTTKNTTINIYASASHDNTEKVLFFSKSALAPNINFHRRFANPSQHIQVEVLNNDASVGDCLIITTASNSTQFNASTFLNSLISVDANTNLARVANDYNTDMVRGLHEDFKKINIQAITETQLSAEATIGCSTQNILDIPVASYSFHANFAGTNDTSAGTGAQQIQIDYIDANYDEATATVSSGGGGLVNLGISGRAITRVQVSAVGTGKKNSGAITITEATNTHKFAVMATGANVTHTGVFLIPRNKHLIVTDAQISMVGKQGIVRIYEYKYGGIQTAGSIGDFRINSQNFNSVYRLNGKVDEKTMVLVNVIPDAGAPGATTHNICINLNAVLCPAINAF